MINMGKMLLDVADTCREEFMLVLKGKPIWNVTHTAMLRYWTEPELPKDLVVEGIQEYDSARATMTYVLRSSKFPDIPEGGVIPKLNLAVHLGNPPKKVFIFR